MIYTPVLLRGRAVTEFLEILQLPATAQRRLRPRRWNGPLPTELWREIVREIWQAGVGILNTNTMQRAIASPVTDTTHMSVTASGANRCAFMPIVYDQAAGMSVSAVTYGGQTCLAAGSASHGTVGHEYAEIWYLVNPPTGLNTLSITVAGTVADIFYNLVAFTGVNQTTPVRAGTYQSGTNQSSTAGTFSMVVASNALDLTMTAINGGNAGVGPTNQTSDGINNAGTYGAGSDHATTAASSVTHSWSITGTVEIAAVGFSINGAPAAGGIPPMDLMHRPGWMPLLMQ